MTPGSNAGSNSSEVPDGGATIVAAARELLLGWTAPTSHDEDLRGRYLDFLEGNPGAGHRDHRPGHLTASTLLLDDPGEQVLLTLHPLAGRWFQLGGHCEPGDVGIGAAALREATEESGMTGIRLHPVPVGLDWHATHCRDSAGAVSPSSHLDIEYVAWAPAGATASRTEESLDLAWFRLDALPGGADRVVRTLVARARALGLA